MPASESTVPASLQPPRLTFPPRSSAVRTARSIALAGKLTALVSPGGGEVQLQKTAEALNQRGLRVRAWRPWEEGFEGIDCLHLFGSCPEHLPVVEAARCRGIPVVLSTIAWFDWQSRWREGRNLWQKLSACGKLWLQSAVPKIPTWRRRLYHAVDRLLPNSHAEAAQLRRFFAVPAENIAVVPNGAEERFAFPRRVPFPQIDAVGKFVLYPGRIEPRKNQLGFLRALRGTDLPVVLLGDPVAGHEDYYAACRAAATPQVTFLSRLEHEDPRLESLYAACGCVVLASWFETPGLVALEAGMSGVPLVLPQAGATREYFGAGAAYVAPTNLRQIRAAVCEAMTQGRNIALAARVRARFTWRQVAECTCEVYESLV